MPSSLRKNSCRSKRARTYRPRPARRSAPSGRCASPSGAPRSPRMSLSSRSPTKPARPCGSPARRPSWRQRAGEAQHLPGRSSRPRDQRTLHMAQSDVLTMRSQTTRMKAMSDLVQRASAAGTRAASTARQGRSPSSAPCRAHRARHRSCPAPGPPRRCARRPARPRGRLQDRRDSRRLKGRDLGVHEIARAGQQLVADIVEQPHQSRAGAGCRSSSSRSGRRWSAASFALFAQARPSTR